MAKRFQVFLSSTFLDLQEERRKVIDALMKMNCIPAGMELFPAADDEQFEFIKRVIDDSDYYVLIVGGRYGSLSREGISFTEKEYRYAVERRIKVLSFLHDEPGKISFEKSEPDEKQREKLEAFRREVSKGRLVQHWRTADELAAQVIISMQNAIMSFPAVGWIRANEQSSVESASEILRLRKQSDELIKQLSNYELNGPTDTENLSQGGDSAEVMYRIELRRARYGEGYSDWTYFKTSWDEIFASLGPHLLVWTENGDIFNQFAAITKALDDANFTSSLPSTEYHENSTVELDVDSYNATMLQFRALGLIEHNRKAEDVLSWRLTTFGDNYLIRRLSKKRKPG